MPLWGKPTAELVLAAATTKSTWFVLAPYTSPKVRLCHRSEVRQLTSNSRAAHTSVMPLSFNRQRAGPADKKNQDIESARAAITRYTDYRVTQLPFLFSGPLTALAYSLLPMTMVHRLAEAAIIGFGVGIPLGELSRYIWLHRVHRRRDT